MPNWFLHIGAVQRKTCTTTPNVLKISNPITANGTVKLTAINAKEFTIEDLALTGCRYHQFLESHVSHHHK